MIFLSSTRFRSLFLLMGVFLSGNVYAQRGGSKPVPFDTNYYVSFPKHLTLRTFGSYKYTTLNLGKGDGNHDLRFRPNNPLSAGIGGTYGILTGNIGFALPFTGPSDAERGKTKLLDLQTHVFPRKWIIDLFGQFYKGYYLDEQGLGAKDATSYYIRPDMHVTVLGFSGYRILNWKRFSYRAPFLQNEWQKKSAGTFLVGLEFQHGRVKADSAFVPSTLSSQFEKRNIEKLRSIQFGPGIGYAYTLVVKKHFYAMGSVNLNGDISLTREFIADQPSTNRTTINPNLLFRAVVGYNSSVWSTNVSWIGNRLAFRGKSSNQEYLVATGNVRFTIARRFNLKGKLRKAVDKVEKKLPILSADGI